MKNRIKVGDARHLASINNESIHLTVTSPPYNVGINYGEGHDDNLALDDYIKFTRDWIAEQMRVLVPGGRLAINVGNTGRKPYVYLNGLVTRACLDAGFLMRQEFIWFKGRAVAAAKTSWGSWRDAKNPVTRDCHEYILVFNKPYPDPENPYKMDCDAFQKSTHMDGSKFAILTFSVWEFKPEPSNNLHPAPFPVELPRRLIDFYTRPGMNVMDPFSGSGNTAIACVTLPEPRNYFCFDIEEKWVRYARKRLSKYNMQKLEVFTRNE